MKQRRDRLSQRTAHLTALLAVLAGVLPMVFPLRSKAAPPWVASTNAVEFFTNLSTRLLRAEGYLFEAGSIPVYSNGKFAFSPDVHRLLQVAANIYDASTNRADRGGPDFPFLPSVFRPVFKVQGSNVFIGNWTEETDGSALASTPRLLTSPAIAATVLPDDNIFDVPWIIGAKKGFPNFNEFSLHSVASITRQLQLVKPTPAHHPNRTNQMFTVGISNAFAFEAWNSYPSNYTRDVQIIALNDLTVELCFTNDPALDPRGERLTANFNVAGLTILPASTWAGAGNPVDAPVLTSFVVPLETNFVFLPNSIFRTDSPPSPQFVTSTNMGTGLRAGFEDTGRFPIPEFRLSFTNRIRFYMVDTATGRLIDYVCLGELTAQRNLTDELGYSGVTIVGDDFNGALLWETNRIGGSSVFALPVGVLTQIQVALGNINLPNWTPYGVNQPIGSTRNKEIDSFRTFCGLASIYYPGTINTNLVAVVPFTPTRRTSQTRSWQANDPLVHSLTANLSAPASGNGLRPELPAGPIQVNPNIGRLNQRFEPWSETLGTLQTRQNVLLKDPLARSSADWPEGGFGPLSLSWLGRVHRGTPWQTIYLKSGMPALTLWTNWLGGWPPSAAAQATPDTDWAIAAELARLVNTTHPFALLSANDSDTNAWLEVFDGLTALTNTASDANLRTAPAPPMAEIPVLADAPQSHAVVVAIQQLQQQSGPLRHPGELFAAPELSLASPWLNRSSEIQLKRGITDEAYEKLPAQLLPLLRSELEVTLINTATALILHVRGYDGFPCAIEASSDLAHWQRIGTNQPANGLFWFTDDSASGVDARFYRAVVLP